MRNKLVKGELQRIVGILLLEVFCVFAKAQDSGDYEYQVDYDNYVYESYDYNDYSSDDYHYNIPCDHNSAYAMWRIISIKESVQSSEPALLCDGMVTLSDNCIYFDSSAFRYYFGVQKYQRVMRGYVKVERDRADEDYDQLEIRFGMGPLRDKILLLIGQKYSATDDDGDEHEFLRNTMQIICRPARGTVNAQQVGPTAPLINRLFFKK